MMDSGSGMLIMDDDSDTGKVVTLGDRGIEIGIAMGIGIQGFMGTMVGVCIEGRGAAVMGVGYEREAMSTGLGEDC